LNPRSLRVRLLFGAAAAIFIALAAAWFAMTLLFERHIERRVEAELTRDALQLVADLSLDEEGKPVVARTPSDARFTRPASGLYWQLSTPAGTWKSRSLWDQALPASPAAENEDWTHRVAPGPFDQRVFLVERVVRPDRDRSPVLVQLALDEASTRTAGREFGRELASFLALLWLILSAAAWVQVHLGLRPLRAVRRELDALRNSPAERLSAEHPPEIEALTGAINALADAREKDLAAARRRAADLAHGLKTPLAALSAQSRRAREAGAGEAADGLDRAIAAAAAAVDAELARSRAATIRQSARGTTAPLAVVERVIGVVERTDFGAERVFDVDVPQAMTVPVAADDLAELLGALIENAARFARRRVRICGNIGTLSTLVIEDDGPGLGPGRAEEAFARGARLDERGPGHGLGLSIARELVEATGGAIRMESSTLGGLRAVIEWPR
jgi:signal transduction histidine kinase